MPSKQGFGDSRTPMTKKVSYGSAMHYKNPVKLTKGAKAKLMASDAGPEFKAAISKQAPTKMYDKSPVKKDTKINMNDPKQKKNYAENKDNPAYRAAMDKKAGGKFSYDEKTNKGTVKKSI